MASVISFFSDTIILAIFGLLLGELFFDKLVQLGSYGRLLGFVIATIYFGVLDSKLANGQSCGKRIFKIQVVNKNGELISLKNSLLRAALLSGVICSNGVNVNNFTLFNFVIIFFIFSLFVGMIYFYIFNTRTRQSIHDLICGTYVYKVAEKGTPITINVARVHYFVYLLLILVGIGGIYWVKGSFNNEFQKLNNICNELKTINGINNTQVDLIYSKNGQRLQVSTYILNKAMPRDEILDTIVRRVLEKYPEAYKLQQLDIEFNYGYNIGIVTRSKCYNESDSISGWKKRLHITQLPNEKQLPSMLNTTVIEEIMKNIKLVYNTKDDNALYSIMGDKFKTSISFSDFEKSLAKIREVGEMKQAVYSYYTYLPWQDGTDVFELFYTAEYGAGNGYVKVIIMPVNNNDWQIIGLWMIVEK